MHKTNSSARAILVVFSRFILAFISVGVYKSFGVFFDSFINELDSRASIVGLSCSLFVGLGNLLGPFTTIFDGLVSVRQMVILGSLMTSAGLGIVCVASNGILLLIGMIVAGVGQAFTLVPTVEPLFWYFPDMFATVNGISLSGAAVGMMIMPPISERLIQAYGWRNAFGILAVFSLNGVVAGCILKRPAFKQKNEARNQITSGNILAELRIRLNLNLFTKSPTFAMFQFIFVLNGLIYTTWVLFLVPHAVLKGFSLSMAVYLSTVGGVGVSIGCIINGPLVDLKFISCDRFYAVLMFILATCFTLDVLAKTFWILAIFAFFVGICVGAQFPMAMVVAKSLVEEERFALSAIAWTFVSKGIGNTLAGPLTGWLQEVTGDYTVMFMGLGIVHIFIGLVIIVHNRKNANYHPLD